MAGTIQNGAIATEGYSVAEAAAQLGRKPRTVRRYIETGQLAARRVRTPRGLEYRITDLTLRYAEDGLGRPQPAEVDRGMPRPTGDDQGTDPGMPRPAEPVPVAENQVLVPIDAWQRMLEQLGNLHQAGQQLAEARERAAKAETEATFLRERLAELRTENERLREMPAPAHVDGHRVAETPASERRPWWRFW